MRNARSLQTLRFSEADRRRLAHARRHTRDARTHRRLQAVALAASGYPPSEIARILGCAVRSVYGWIDRYRQRHRVDDLADAPRAGRPRVASAITDGRILRALQRDPWRLGHSSTGWTVGLLAQHLSERHGCPISARTLRRRMKALGLRWKRPRYVYLTKAPHLAQKKGRSSAA